MDQPSDETLMLALRGGDDAALAPLMEHWELPVKAFLARFGVGTGDVEDLAQETFVRLYQTRAKFRPGAAFKPWILTIAGNLARNRIRWRTRHPAETIEGADDAPADSASEASAASERSDLARSVRQAVDTLPAPLREAVVCVELEDMSQAEAASVLACTPKAVETRLYRARQALRTLLAPILAELRR